MKKKYVYLTPYGGFNDCLCVIQNAVQYCIQHNRILLIDMKHSFYRINLSDYFEIKNSECEIIYNSNKIKKILLDNTLTVYPTNFEYDLEYILEYGIYKNIYLNYQKSINEDVILHKAYGNGNNGYDFFKQLLPCQELKLECKKKLDIIGTNYLSIHVRDTDISGKIPFDYINLFEKHKKEILKYEKIYVATDSNTVLNYFKSKHKNVYNFTTFPKSGAIHTSNICGKKKIYDLICDMYIITNSNNLLSNSKGSFIKLLRSCFNRKTDIKNNYIIK